MAEINFFQNPEAFFFPLQSPLGTGQADFCSGFLYVFVGILYWRKIMSDVPKNSWLDPVIMNIDKAAFLILSAASLSMTIFSFTYGNRFAGQSLAISLFIAILSAALAVWRYYEPTPRAIYLYSQPEFSLTKVEYDDTLKYSAGRWFRFSKFKDPSEVMGLVTPSRAEEIPAKGKSGPEFRMSRLEDQTAEEDGEE
jgi:hypothetical protein